MKQVQQKISPAAFDRLQRSLLRANLEGYGPDDCVRIAMTSIGLQPVDGQHTIIIVDPSLDGPVFPFMDWPAELAATR